MYRDTSEHEIREVGEGALIIESYPDDRYSPTCLLLGYTRVGRPLHIQASLAEVPYLKIVTMSPMSLDWLWDGLHWLGNIPERTSDLVIRLGMLGVVLVLVVVGGAIATVVAACRGDSQARRNIAGGALAVVIAVAVFGAMGILWARAA